MLFFLICLCLARPGNNMVGIFLSVSEDRRHAGTGSDGASISPPVYVFFYTLSVQDKAEMRRVLSLPAGTPERSQLFDDGQPSVSVDYVSRPFTYNMAHIQRMLGFVPRVDLDEGFRRIAASL